MKSISLGILALTGLTGCAGSTAFEQTRPLGVRNDMTVQTVAAVECTRGEIPFALRVAPDGSAEGRVIPPPPLKGQKAPPVIEFPASLKAVDPETVLLVVGPDFVTQGPVSEELSPVLKGGEVMLRGDSFDCTDVLVRL